MVKLLKEGTPVRKWWAGHKAICHSCGATMELELTDEPRITSLTHPMVDAEWETAIVTCPCCGAEAGVKHPNGPRY